MTSSQKFRLYLPAWAEVVRVQGWRMDRATHRLVGPRREFWGGDETSRLYARVWQHADTLSVRAARGVRPDDLRHGVHVAALGRDMSSSGFDNRQLDRVLVALRLLANADDVGAMLSWLHPEQGVRSRRVWWLRNRCHPAYVARVARDMYGVADWSGLDDHQIGVLYGRLKHRPGAVRRDPEDRADRTDRTDPTDRVPTEDELIAFAMEGVE